MTMRGARTILRDQRGAAAVEMALMLPLLLILMFACLEGAYYLYIEHQIVKGVRDGARFAARQSFANFTCSTVNATVVANTKEVTRTGQISGGTARVPGWTAANSSTSNITVSASCPATAITTGIYKDLALANAPQVTVSATVSYHPLFATISGFSTSLKVYAKDQAAVMGV